MLLLLFFLLLDGVLSFGPPGPRRRGVEIPDVHLIFLLLLHKLTNFPNFDLAPLLDILLNLLNIVITMHNSFHKLCPLDPQHHSFLTPADAGLKILSIFVEGFIAEDFPRTNHFE